MSWAAIFQAPPSWWPLQRSVRRRLTGQRLAAVAGVFAVLAAWSGAAAGPSDIGIVIANAAYRESGIQEVKYAEKDGDAMASAMEQVFGITRGNLQRRRNLTKSDLDTLFGNDRGPQGSTVWRLVEGANNRKARLIVYYSGHGAPPYEARDRTRSEAGLLTWDASFDDIKKGVYALQTLRDNLRTIKQRLLPEGEVILILESCFSGQAGDGKPLRQGASASVFPIARTAPPDEIVEIAAAQDTEAAFWDASSRHGMFTHQLLWGLYGRADSNGDGRVTLRELEAYVKRRLEDKGGRQTASFSRAGDIVLAAGPWPQRRDMIEAEAREDGVCEEMRHDEGNYETLIQHIEALKDYPETCAWCGCEAEVREHLTRLEEKELACRGVRASLNAATKPGALEGLIKKNKCPELHADLLDKMRRLLKDTGNAAQIRAAEERIRALEQPHAGAAEDAAVSRPAADAAGSARRTATATFVPPASTSEFGRRDEARAMVERVQRKIAKDGKPATYRAINNGEKEFNDRDLYPFIIEFTGMEPANGGTPEVRGKDVSDLRDEDGKYIIRDLIAIAREQRKGWYDYRWLNPKTRVVEDKSSYVERIGNDDVLVGVGVYRNEQPNENTVGLVSGSPNSDETYLQMAYELAEVLNDEDKLRVLPIAGIGGPRNIRDVRYTRGVDIGLTQTSILNNYRRNNERMGKRENKIVYIAALFNEEVHLVARNNITSIQQLQGLKVNLDIKGSGTSYSMRDIFKTLNIVVQEVSMSQAEALEKVRSGEIAATALIAGKPVRSMSRLTPADGLHFVPLPFSQPLAPDYRSASLTHDDYPDLIPAGQPVDTVATGAVLISFNWPKTSTDRYQRIERFVEEFFRKIEDFKKPPYHPKWREVNLAATLPDWTRFEAAQSWLNRQRVLAGRPN